MIVTRALFSLGALALLMGCSSLNQLPPHQSDAALVAPILKALDDRSLSVEQQLSNYTDTAVVLVPGETEHRGLDALRVHLGSVGDGVELVTRHEVVELQSFQELVVVQGKVIGRALPQGAEEWFHFETKNLILFERQLGGGLKISRVIYNMAPPPSENPENNE